MIISLIGLALIAGATAYFRFRAWCVSELWSSYRRQCAAERTSSRLPIPRVEPRRWNYQLGIPLWNPALMLASGFDPRSYRPHPGDSHLVL